MYPASLVTVAARALAAVMPFFQPQRVGGVFLVEGNGRVVAQQRVHGVHVGDCERAPAWRRRRAWLDGASVMAKTCACRHTTAVRRVFRLRRMS